MPSFIFHLRFTYRNLRTNGRLAFVGWLGMARYVWLAGNVTVVWICVVLSSGLERNSYTPAGRVREVLLDAYHEVNGAFASLSIARRSGAQEMSKNIISFHFHVLLHGMIHHAPIISRRIHGIPYQLVAVQVAPNWSMSAMPWQGMVATTSQTRQADPRLDKYR
jgi:hypothetical protein